MTDLNKVEDGWCDWWEGLDASDRLLHAGSFESFKAGALYVRRALLAATAERLEEMHLRRLLDNIVDGDDRENKP